MPQCKVIGCKVGSGRYNGPKTRMFRLPKDETMRQQWLAAIGRPDLQVSDHDGICSLHFGPEDYEEKRRDSHGRMPKLPKRKENALPHLRLKPVRLLPVYISLPDKFLSISQSYSSGFLILSGSTSWCNFECTFLTSGIFTFTI